MTREDRLKLVVTAIENMVVVQIATNGVAVDKGKYGFGAQEEARQELLSALVRSDTEDDVEW